MRLPPRVEPRETLDYVHKEISSLWQVRPTLWERAFSDPLRLFRGFAETRPCMAPSRCGYLPCMLANPRVRSHWQRATHRCKHMMLFRNTPPKNVLRQVYSQSPVLGVQYDPENVRREAAAAERSAAGGKA